VLESFSKEIVALFSMDVKTEALPHCLSGAASSRHPSGSPFHTQHLYHISLLLSP